jgi:hypothetical protein
MRADRRTALFLDRAQQLDLHRQRQVADLVQEQRAAVRRPGTARSCRRTAPVKLPLR